MTSQAAKQMAATSMVSTIAKLISITSQMYEGGAEQMTLCMTAAMPGMTGVCHTLGNTPIDGQDYTPTADHMLFASLMLANSCSFSSNNHHMVMEYSTEHILVALDQFTKLTNRSFEDQMDKRLLEAVNTIRSQVAEVAKNPNIGQFLPH